jgi:antitoxin PrlF
MTTESAQSRLHASFQQRLRSHRFLTSMHSVRIRSEAMSTDSTLTSKGQTTIPKEIRETLGMKPGDRMTFTMLPDGTVLMRVKNKSVMSLAGSLRKKGQKPVPVELLSR